jgi:hypothetical protein
MTLYRQFESAIDDVENTVLQTGSDFFVVEVIPKLQIISDLMEMRDIEHSDFQAYLQLFRNDIRLDIEKCLEITPGTPLEEKEALLNLIKKHVRPKIKVLEYAFSFYLKDDGLLHADNRNKRTSKMPSERRLTNKKLLGALDR